MGQSCRTVLGFPKLGVPYWGPCRNEKHTKGFLSEVPFLLNPRLSVAGISRSPRSGLVKTIGLKLYPPAASCHAYRWPPRKVPEDRPDGGSLADLRCPVALFGFGFILEDVTNTQKREPKTRPWALSPVDPRALNPTPSSKNPKPDCKPRSPPKPFKNFPPNAMTLNPRP